MLLSDAVRQSCIPANDPVARSRVEMISRYRRFRAISKMHANGAFHYMAWEFFRDQARRLGIAHGKTFILNAIDELAFANDLALYGRHGTCKRPLDRYAAAQCFLPDSDEALVLRAMLAARFVIVRVERHHPEAVARCRRRAYGAVVLRFLTGAGLEPVPVNLSIKNGPDEVVQRLRQRARAAPSLASRRTARHRRGGDPLRADVEPCRIAGGGTPAWRPHAGRLGRHHPG
ncbi:MAG TPA: hypothetical protein VGL35_11525 [Rhizomicrobium sp.]|jgi:hypothetical protein